MSLALFKRLVRGALFTPFLIRDWLPFYVVYFRTLVPSLDIYLGQKDIVRLRNGLTVAIRPLSTDRFIINETWLHRDYDPDGKSIHSNDVVIDLGAHIGTFSLYAAQHGATVYAVEPNPESYALLEKNRSNNKIGSKIFPIKVAIHPTRKRLPLYLNRVNPGMSSIVDHSDRSVDVEAMSLEQIMKRFKIEHCDLLKCDIEGGEYELFYTLPDALYEKIDQIYLEFHDHPDIPDNSGQALAKYLSSKGYRVRSYFTYLYADKKKVVQ